VGFEGTAEAVHASALTAPARAAIPLEANRAVKLGAGLGGEECGGGCMVVRSMQHHTSCAPGLHTASAYRVCLVEALELRRRGFSE
jgi:hypothetical protein